MITKITQEFLNKDPNDEEMMAFLKEQIYTGQLVPDDILSIIERLNDEKNKHKAINRYAVDNVLSLNMERFFDIMLNIKDQGISERLEYIIIQRLEKLKDNIQRSGNLEKINFYNKKISKAISGYISGLEDIGQGYEKTEYIDRAKELAQDSVESSMITEVDFMNFIANVDFSKWNRQDLKKYEGLLKPENYQELMEMWEEWGEEQGKGKETKNLIDGVIQEAKQQGIPLENLAKEFFETIANEGINSDDLYKWILNSNVFKLVGEQREELSTGEKEFKESNIEK